MNELTQSAVIESEAIGCIERSCPSPAESASAFQIQRKPVLKGSLALRAEILRAMLGGFTQTSGTDRNACIPGQRFIANAAFVGE
jgi:hypothetical protein